MGETPSWFVVRRAASPLERALEVPGGGLTREVAAASSMGSARISAVLPLCCVAGENCSTAELVPRDGTF